MSDDDDYVPDSDHREEWNMPPELSIHQGLLDEIRRLEYELSSARDRMHEAETVHAFDMIDAMREARARYEDLKNDLERRVQLTAGIRLTSLNDRLAKAVAESQKFRQRLIATETENERLWERIIDNDRRKTMRRKIAFLLVALVGGFLFGIGMRAAMWMMPTPQTKVLLCYATQADKIADCQPVLDLIRSAKNGKDNTVAK